MIKDELKKEAEEYRKEIKSKFFLSEPQLDLSCQGYIDGLKAREKRIAELEVQLEREKNLNQCLSDHNEQLRELIEKMKCCGNCDVGDKACYVRTQEHVNICPSWKLKEIKEK